MGFFGQRRQRGHLKASSSAAALQTSHSQQPNIYSHRKAAHSQSSVTNIERPPRPPRPQRKEPVYSFPPPPPLWNRPVPAEEQVEFRIRTPPTIVVPHMEATPALIGDPELSSYNPEYDTVYDVVGDKLSEVISAIDEDTYFGSDRDLVISLPLSVPSTEEITPTPATADSERTLVNFTIPQSRYQTKTGAYQQSQQRQEKTINFLNKVSYYANSSLPLELKPLRVYIPTWPLLCLAAQYSSTAYQSPSSSDWSDRMSAYIPSNAAIGTKAMIVKSVPCDSKKVIVFAIRGTSVLSLRDWNTNLNTKPTSPDDFLDDPGNLCHAGFLRVAKAMIKPISARLRQLLEQNPSRSECSLLITGHSAGGAVASLIYSHMLSRTVVSDLTVLASCFKRVHCVTFGAPPVTLLPLSKPADTDGRMQKCLFHSFINEGDPVSRAEKPYVRSLVELVATQLPSAVKGRWKSPATVAAGLDMVTAGLAKLDMDILPSVAYAANEGKKQVKKMASRPQGMITSKSNNELRDKAQQQNQAVSSAAHKPSWPVPPSTLSNAGRLVVLRITPLLESTTAPRQTQNSHQNHVNAQLRTSSSSATTTAMIRNEYETVRAEIVTDEQLRTVVFGDPLMHSMEVYRRRIEALAMKAVTGQN